MLNNACRGQPSPAVGRGRGATRAWGHAAGVLVLHSALTCTPNTLCASVVLVASRLGLCRGRQAMARVEGVREGLEAAREDARRA